MKNLDVSKLETYPSELLKIYFHLRKLKLAAFPRALVWDPSVIFFLIDMNDLGFLFKHSNLDLYANYSTIYTPRTDLLEIENNLQNTITTIVE